MNHEKHEKTRKEIQKVFYFRFAEKEIPYSFVVNSKMKGYNYEQG